MPVWPLTNWYQYCYAATTTVVTAFTRGFYHYFTATRIAASHRWFLHNSGTNATFDTFSKLEHQLHLQLAQVQDGTGMLHEGCGVCHGNDVCLKDREVDNQSPRLRPNTDRYCLLSLSLSRSQWLISSFTLAINKSRAASTTLLTRPVGGSEIISAEAFRANASYWHKL